MIRCKKNIPFIIVSVISLIIAALYFVAYMDMTIQNKAMKSWNLFHIIKQVFSTTQTRNLFLYSLLGIIWAVVALWVSDTKSYQSKQMIITDKISTPVPAGQGQCGTARWLQKNMYDKAFHSYELDIQELKEWDEMKLQDIEEELRRME